jgi:hypothetical protein
LDIASILKNKNSARPFIRDFNYREYRPDSHLFIMNDVSLGVIYRVTLLEHETMSIDELSELKSQLEQWMNFPSNCVVQFLFQQSGLSTEEIDLAVQLESKPECDFAEYLREQRIAMMKEMSKVPGKLMKRNCYFSIRFIPESSPFNVADLLPESLADSLSSGVRRFDARVAEFEKLLSRIESLSKISLTRIDADELRSVLARTLIQPNTECLAPINPDVPLNEQLLFQSLEANEKGLTGKKLTRTVSLLVPSDHFEGASSLFLNLPFPIDLSLRMTFPSKAKIGRFLATKEWCTKNSFSAKSQRQFEELQATKKRLAEGDRCVHLCWSVTVSGDSEQEVLARANKVCALAIEAFNCNSIVEDEIGFDLLRSSLPLHYDPKSEWGTQRHIPLHQSEIINFIPIFDSFRGTRVPLQVYRSREGNLLPISATEGQTSLHMKIIGDSGSGKSALINSLINGFKALPTEPIVFVVDFNTSQTMNVKYYKGELNLFSENESCPASVFRGVYDLKKVSVITKWVSTAVKLTSPSFQIESEHREANYQAVKNAYRKKALEAGIRFIGGDLFEIPSNVAVYVDMDSIANELSYLPAQEGFERFKPAIEDLLVKLRNFYGDGLYARYFKPSSETQTYDKRFYVYDLVRIQEDPVLLDLTIASLFEEFRQVKMMPENQDREVWAILDEIAVLGRESDVFSEYFVIKSETGRKDTFWIVGATNRPQNYADIPVCRALSSVSEYTVYLPMSIDNIKKLREIESGITDADAENIASLEIKKNQYTEVMIASKSTKVKGVFRFEQSHADRWQSPTNPKATREALKALEKHPEDIVGAIKYLTEKFPEGVS